MAFQIPPTQVAVKGMLPGRRALDEMSVQVAPLVPFLTMKRIALEDRRKAKDAYDIYFVLQNYSSGVDEVVKAFRPHLKLGLVQTSGLEIAGGQICLDRARRAARRGGIRIDLG